MVYGIYQCLHYDEFMYNLDKDELYFDWMNYKLIPNGVLLVRLKKSEETSDFFHSFYLIDSANDIIADIRKGNIWKKENWKSMCKRFGVC